MLHPARRPDSGPRFLRWFLIAGILALAAAIPAAAQLPSPHTLFVTVTTDKATYAPGERVLITVQVRNVLDREQVLRFTSSLQADYLIDYAYRWSTDRAFLTVATSVVVPPQGSCAFPVFEHRPGDYYLAPGSHDITAEVAGCVSGTATITVEPGEPVVPHTYVFGTVTNEPPPGSKQAIRPIAGALVALLRVSSGSDSGGVTPGDSAGPPAESGRAVRLLDPPPPDVRPPRPSIAILSIFHGITDSLGRYEIRVPAGRYRALAGAPNHRYEWYEGAAGWVDADEAFVNNDLTDMIPIPTSFSLPDLPAEAPAAVITGIVRGYPLGDRDSSLISWPGVADSLSGGGPLAGAWVTARPLLENPLLMRPAPVLYQAETDSGGVYTMRLPADSPVIVRAGAPGRVGQVYDHAVLAMLATPVDVAPGKWTEAIDFDLVGLPGFPNLGSITGVVRSADPRYRDCGRCLPQPLAGALVRARVAGEGPGLEFTTLTDGNGSFALRGLPLGRGGVPLTYVVSAEAPGHLPAYHPGVYRQDAAKTVTPTPPWIQTFVSTAIQFSLQVQTETGPHFAVGLVCADGGGVDSLPPIDGREWLDLLDTPPADSTDPGLPVITDLFRPLEGAFLYLVAADDTVNAVPVAGGVTRRSGLLVLRELPAGRYRAYADRPGFGPAWFRGPDGQGAAVISIGPGIDPTLIYIRLASVDSTTTPGEGGGESDPAEAPVFVNLHNSPNPFQPQTTIIYRLLDAVDVSVRVFDLNGRLVRTLFDRVPQAAGEQRVPWDGRDDRGAAVGAGIYFYRVATPGHAATGKMVMVR